MRLRLSLFLGLLRLEFDYYTDSHWADEELFPEEPYDPDGESVEFQVISGEGNA